MSALSRSSSSRPCGPCAASSDAGRAPRRRDAQILPAPGERARCRPGDARGLEVSPGCLLQDQLVQRQVGNRSAQPRVLSLEILQPLDLIALEPAKLLAPAVVRDLRNPNRAYRLGNALPLRHQHIHLAQLRNDLLGLVSLPRHPWSSLARKPYLRADHLKGGGSQLQSVILQNR